MERFRSEASWRPSLADRSEGLGARPNDKSEGFANRCGELANRSDGLAKRSEGFANRCQGLANGNEGSGKQK